MALKLRYYIICYVFNTLKKAEKIQAHFFNANIPNPISLLWLHLKSLNHELVFAGKIP